MSIKILASLLEVVNLYAGWVLYQLTNALSADLDSDPWMDALAIFNIIINGVLFIVPSIFTYGEYYNFI